MVHITTVEYCAILNYNQLYCFTGEGLQSTALEGGVSLVGLCQQPGVASVVAWSSVPDIYPDVWL